mgnify:CR=1 FL=1
MIDFRLKLWGKLLIILLAASLFTGCESQTESISRQVQKQPPTTIAQIVAMVAPAVVHIQAIQGPAALEQPSSLSE